METKTLADLKPMRKWDEKVAEPVKIEIRDPEHFHRVAQFASDNMLSVQFETCLARLLNLMVQTGGTIWTDGLETPGFIWHACGMTGGMIFHASSRDWSLHT